MNEEENTEEELTKLAKLGWELSTHAAAINWSRARNTSDWLNTLRQRINAYQEAYKKLFGEQGAMKVEPRYYTATGAINTFHRGMGNQAVTRYAEATSQPPDLFTWVDQPEPGTWYDFYDLTTGKLGQCRLRADGTWEQEPLGTFPALIAYRGTP